VDFENLDAHSDAFKNLDVGYCCLGTTRRRSGAVSLCNLLSYRCNPNLVCRHRTETVFSELILVRYDNDAVA